MRAPHFRTISVHPSNNRGANFSKAMTQQEAHSHAADKESPEKKKKDALNLPPWKAVGSA
jgi:hypothetical protein